MSNIHILTGDGKNKWTAVFHIAVPDTNNSVSVNYRTGLINSGLGGTSTMAEGDGPGQITTAELAQIASGELYECSVPLLIETGGTSVPELRTMLRSQYTKKKNAVLSDLQTRLRYFGHTESEAA